MAAVPFGFQPIGSEMTACRLQEADGEEQQDRMRLVKRLKRKLKAAGRPSAHRKRIYL